MPYRLLHSYAGRVWQRNAVMRKLRKRFNRGSIICNLILRFKNKINWRAFLKQQSAATTVKKTQKICSTASLKVYTARKTNLTYLIQNFMHLKICA